MLEKAKREVGIDYSDKVKAALKRAKEVKANWNRKPAEVKKKIVTKKTRMHFLEIDVDEINFEEEETE